MSSPSLDAVPLLLAVLSVVSPPRVLKSRLSVLVPTSRPLLLALVNIPIAKSRLWSLLIASAEMFHKELDRVSVSSALRFYRVADVVIGSSR